ncbi:hypothetical protein LAZ67_3004486 [Cordylochernes scorpioides]|uniref:ATP-dependent DNA helicase PIF1 n=1 Tax=Cordylochernes scorpioides TaxID=51811 RepID=A0ABY6KAR1_9ARAC|nr:hypothetical protein LAZ67_3004486 [Cordylochernes scorpioides]
MKKYWIAYQTGVSVFSVLTVWSPHFLEAQILTETKVRHTVLVPKISLAPSGTNLPFILKRRQFPLRLAFAMTINKAQGQTFARVEPVFTQGQLYVAFSHVLTLDSIRVKLGLLIYKTRNVVFNESTIYIWIWTIAVAAVHEDACVLGDLTISEESATDFTSGSIESLTGIRDKADLINAATLFDATHIPTRVTSCGSRVEVGGLDRILIPSRLSNHVNRYWVLHYRLLDHRAVLPHMGNHLIPIHLVSLSCYDRDSSLIVWHPSLTTIADMTPRDIEKLLQHQTDIIADIKSLDVSRITADDYVTRAWRFLKARLYVYKRPLCFTRSRASASRPTLQAVQHLRWEWQHHRRQRGASLGLVHLSGTLLPLAL